MDKKAVAKLLRSQAGVVMRRQLLGLGVTDNDIERMVRRRELARVHDGVFAEHTGPLTKEQRGWAAVLVYWPAALSGTSALDAHGLRGFDRGEEAPVRVCVDRSRTVTRRAGVRVEQLAGFEDKCQMHLSPPRLRLEHALLGTAAEKKREDAALAVLADACQQGRTTPARLVDALADRPRLKHRRLLLSILEDVAGGTYSVLERRYLRDVERPHGLPTGARQRRVRLSSSAAYRDVEYVELGTVVELDGCPGHEDALDRWADLERDLSSVVAGDVTLRVGWKRVLEPCRLAGIVGQILKAQGWTLDTAPCRPDCPLTYSAGSPAPGAGDPGQTEPPL